MQALITRLRPQDCAVLFGSGNAFRPCFGHLCFGERAIRRLQSDSESETARVFGNPFASINVEERDIHHNVAGSLSNGLLNGRRTHLLGCNERQIEIA